jgi:hypothetical protein
MVARVDNLEDTRKLGMQKIRPLQTMHH